MRDLVRAREDLRMDLMRASHRLGKVPVAPRDPLRGAGQQLDRAPPAVAEQSSASRTLPPRLSFEDYRGGVEALLHRRSELERRIEGLIPTSPWAREVGRLRCLRGIDTLTAVGLCAEIGDFARFGKAGQLMSYLGLVPSEHSSGESRRLGSITKSGSRHGRRLLVEAAWHYRNPPRVGREIERRQQGQPAAATAVAWSAQRRLHRTYSRMRKRNKRSTVTTVAVARELAGFCWAIALIE